MANVHTYKQIYGNVKGMRSSGSTMKSHSKAMVKSHSMGMGGGMHGNRSGVSKEAAGYISHKISKLRHEGKSEKAAIGQAYGMARQKGYRIPKK